MTQYNLFKDAAKIQNITSCLYDTNKGFSSAFPNNGDVNGWDIYSSICFYGVWNSVLFGTALDRFCYISRENIIVPFAAEHYYMFSITMKLTIPKSVKKNPSKGKLMWWTSSDRTWTEDKSIEFNLNLTDQWYTYIINVGENQYWQGDICNFRIYPFIDGKPDIQFAIKLIEVKSINIFKCLNTQCEKHLEFIHPCPFIGTYSSITSSEAKTIYSTEDGINDALIINIDGYGNEIVRLGTNTNLSGSEMARVISDRLSRVSIGQYSYAEVNYDDILKTLTIKSGVASENGVINVSGSAAEALGFSDQSEITFGKAPADGFDYYASHRLVGYELNALLDLDTSTTAYIHNPNQYTVEAGRSDYTDAMSSSHSPRYIDIDYYETIDGSFSLIVDGSHPINDCGRISFIVANGKMCGEGSKFVLLRPYKDGTAKIINSVTLPTPTEGIYTTEPVTYSVDVDWLVNKGDLIGFYHFSVLCPFSRRSKKANAVYFKVGGFPSERFNLGTQKAQGLIGLSFYTRSNRLQRNLALSIDMGKRINISELSVFGKEDITNYEYNVAACLDVDWEVYCNNETHWHWAYYKPGGIATRMVVHRNKPYGVSCLSDCIRSADNGKAGDSASSAFMGGSVKYNGTNYVMEDDPDTYSGMVTIGEHSYCYVNGDQEWLNGNQGFAEFYGSWVGSVAYDYEYDPISYIVTFPLEKSLDIHKTGIYFKESNNFKHLSLSYYLGKFGPIGNAELTHYEFVPEFKTITIDGTTLTKGSADGALQSEKYEKVYFSNPWPSAKLEYENGKATNQDVYLTVVNDRMNVIVHEFEPVNCFGFKIQTNWHKSTKLTELELYSSIYFEPSLLDNVFLSISNYNEDWFDLAFTQDKHDATKINSLVLGSPRYFKLELQSQELFSLFEISADVSSEKLKSLECTNTIHITDAPRNAVVTKEFFIENSYEKPLDLYVDIPSELFNTRAILSWLKCNDLDTTINAEIGPGGILRKNPDYPLLLEQGQIANNVPGYCLYNLINSSLLYEKVASNNWVYLGKGDESVNLNNTNLSDYKIYRLEFEPVSSKFWKLNLNSYAYQELLSIKTFSSSNVYTPYQDIFIQGKNSRFSSKTKTSLDAGGNINSASIIDISYFTNTNLTNMSITNNTNSNFNITNGILVPFLSSWQNIYFEKSFDSISSFDFSTEFYFSTPNTLSFSIDFKDESGASVLVFSLTGSDSTTSTNLSIYSPISLKEEHLARVAGFPVPLVFKNAAIDLRSYTNFILKISKRNGTLTTISLLSGTTVIYSTSNELAFLNRISKIRYTYSNNSYFDYYENTLDVGIKSIGLYAPANLSLNESIFFTFAKSEDISAIEIIKKSSDIGTISIYVSNRDNNDYKLLSYANKNSAIISTQHKYITCSEPFNSSANTQWSYPWNPFIPDTNSSYTCYFVPALNHWLKYDFGLGNNQCVTRIYFKTWSSSTYPRTYYNTCYVYGTNVDFDVFNPDSPSVALITSFELKYYNTTPTYSDVSFNNIISYRFLVFYVKSLDGNTHDIQIDNIELYTSYTETPKSILTISTNTFTKYIAIDLSQHHNLWFVRNYGPSDYLLDIYNKGFIDYSSSDTSNINEVNWTEMIPSLLLLFNTFNDSSSNEFAISTSGAVSCSSYDGLFNPNGYGIFEGGFIKFYPSNKLILSNKDFTFDFKMIKDTQGANGVCGCYSGINNTSAFLVKTTFNDYLEVSVFSASTEYILKSSSKIFTDTLYHIAVTRSSDMMYLFINGKLNKSIVISKHTVLNNFTDYFYIGKSTGEPFIGKIAEVRFILNYCVWTYSFVSDNTPYTSVPENNMSNARWIRIPLECGTGLRYDINFLGIYPNIKVAYMPSGVYNCKWIPIGNLLSNYSDYVINLSPRSKIENTEFIAFDFEDKYISQEWLNTDSIGAFNIHQCDFFTSEENDFWSSYNYGDYDSNYGNGLTVDLITGSSNSFFLNTISYPNTSICEISFSFDYWLSNYNTRTFSFTCYVNNTSNYIRINTVLGKNTARLELRTDTILVIYTDLSASNLSKITKLRLTINGVFVTAEYYLNNTWTVLYTNYLFSILENTNVYFSLSMSKTSTFPEDIFKLKYIKCIDTSDISSAVNSIQFISSTSVVLNYNTQGSICQDSLTLKPYLLQNGNNLDAFSIIITNKLSIGGFRLVSESGFPVVGVAYYHNYLKLYGLEWYSLEHSFFVDDTLYFDISFNWEAGICNFTCTNLYKTVSTSFKFSTENTIYGLSFGSFFGGEWLNTPLDLQIDNIIFSLQKSYLYDWSPVNCISGNNTLEGPTNCWCFPAYLETPTLILDLGEVYNIAQFNLYHTPFEDSSEWANNDYTIYISEDAVDYVSVLSVVGNTSQVREHKLQNVASGRYVKLEITKYTKPNTPYIFHTTNSEGTFNQSVDGGFLREFEVISAGPVLANGQTYITSEQYPVVCMDLRLNYDITGHYLVDNNIDNGWDNDDNFFYYSSDMTDNPSKVSFTTNNTSELVFSYSTTWLSSYFVDKVILSDSTYFTAGKHVLKWDLYNTQTLGLVSLNINGIDQFNIASETITSSASWYSQENTFYVNDSGYYSMTVNLNVDNFADTWGFGNLSIQHLKTDSRWLAVIRNTATNFAWDIKLDSQRNNMLEGIDYLKRIRVYSTLDLPCTYGYWWWETGFSNLSTEKINIKVYSRALRINYPQSDLVDYVSYMPGDSFGKDTNFSIKDALSFWLFISDISSIDLTIGGVAFGNFNLFEDVPNSGNSRCKQAYYGWDWSSLKLESGWNEVVLPFCNFDRVYPESNEIGVDVSPDLDFRNYITSSLGFIFKGKGASFYMILDGVTIKRNYFLDTVAYNLPGLCLTWGEFLEIPLSGINVARGSLEFDCKLYTDTAGMDSFGTTSSRTLFTIVTNNNETLALSIRESDWFEVGFGNTKTGYTSIYLNPRLYDLSDVAKDIDDIIHIGIVWNNDGLSLSENHTIRLYINTKLSFISDQTWEVSDYKSALLRFGGGNTYLANYGEADGSAIFSNIKYYNYCKTDFDLTNLYPNEGYKNNPNYFLRISKDGEVYHDTSSSELPFIFKKVLPNESVSISVEIDKNNMKRIDGLTGTLNIDWKVPM